MVNIKKSKCERLYSKYREKYISEAVNMEKSDQNTNLRDISWIEGVGQWEGE